MRSGIHPAAGVGFAAVAGPEDPGPPLVPGGGGGVPRRGASDRAERDRARPRRGDREVHAIVEPTGASVVAVDPIAEMQAKLREALPAVRTLDGTAEAIPLEDGSVDAAVVAQAFHWFDAGTALREIHRVLRSGGRLGRIWNVRDETSIWSRRLTELFDSLSGDGPRYQHGRWRDPFEATDLLGPLHRRSFPYEHSSLARGSSIGSRR